MESKIILFDFDGTIADSAEAALKIYNEFAQKNNYRIITKEDLALLRTMSAMDAAQYFGVPLFKLPFIARKVRAAFKDEIPHLKAIHGIVEQLPLLKNKGYKLFILSSNSKENIKSFLDHNQIKEFDDIYPVSNLFGKHVKIKNLLSANHWDPASVMYVGDEVRDIEAARKAGVIPVAVTWGHNTAEVLEKNMPDRILRTPSELELL